MLRWLNVYISYMQLLQPNGCCWNGHSFLAMHVGIVTHWPLAALIWFAELKEKYPEKKCMFFYQISELNYLGRRLDKHQSWCKELNLKRCLAWGQGSVQKGEVKPRSTLRLWLSRTCFSFSVLPAFCPECAKKLICAWIMQFVVITSYWLICSDFQMTSFL